MKPITKTKTQAPEAQKTAASTDQATPPKPPAQCCAKVSRATMGCHD